MKQVPDLWKYKYCKSLDLSFNLLSAISDEVFRPCNHLKELKLYDNKLVAINKCFRHLNHLENLQLQYNYIEKIDDSLSHCKKLNCLRLDSNKLSTISTSEMCSLHNLTSLDISSNNIEDISFMSCLVLLEEFKCTHNRLRSVPEIKGLKKLKDVDLSYNLIKNISGLKSMSSLNILNIEGNKLKSSKSGVLKSLIHLNISRNHAGKLSELSNQYPNLEILDFSFNELSDVAELQHLFKFENLKELILEGNPIVINYKEKDTMELKEIISKLPLHYYNNRCSDKQKPNSTKQSILPMRPMTANSLVSDRLIAEQLRAVETLLGKYEDDLNAQFNVVNLSLQELPSSRPKCKFFYCCLFHKRNKIINQNV